MRTEQITLENRTSIEAIDELIRVTVEESDVTVLLDKYVRYIEDIRGVESKHSAFHVELIESVDPIKAIKAMLRALIKADATKGASYIDRNVVANAIGRKLLPKSLKAKQASNRKVAELSLGLNLLNIAASMGLIHYKMISTKKKHSVSTLHVNANLVIDTIKEAMKHVRANTIMIVVPTDHNPIRPGGYLTKPGLMLDTSGFNSNVTQPALVCDAANAAQHVGYNIRTNYSNVLMDQYKTMDKWFNEKGQFMVSEWIKLVDDMKLASSVPAFYFPVKFDDRGRMYETSAYIKYQGDSYQKSMLEFANKQECTEEGLAYLAIAITNELYSDKISFEDALEWFNAQSAEHLIELAKGDPIAECMLEDYFDAVDGKPIGTITHWDATNSGLQFYSLLGADKQTASLCNIFDTGVIADAYKALADVLNKLTSTSNFNRSNVKKAFMTFLYGAMMANILFAINDPKNGVTAGIREFFPADWSDDRCWETFESAMTEIAPAAIKLMNIIYSYNLPNTTKFKWTMPDGFKVECTSVTNTSVKGWFMDHSGKTHEGSIDTLIEEFNKFSRALAPNVIHSIDAYFGREVIRRLAAMGIQVSFIHDSFGVHPNHAATLHQVVREVAAHILELDLLTNILGQLNPVMTDRYVRKGMLSIGTLTVDDVLASSYIVR